MKMNAILVTTALILGSSLVLAAGQQQESPQPDAADTVSMEGMTGGCMPMHDHMDEMQAQIDAIYETTDPDKRAELIEAHMLSMSEMMKMTKSMHEGKGKMHKDMMDKGKMDHKEMMDKSMDMSDKKMGMKMGQATQDQATGAEGPTLHEQHHEKTATD